MIYTDGFHVCGNLQEARRLLFNSLNKHYIVANFEDQLLLKKSGFERLRGEKGVTVLSESQYYKTLIQLRNNE